MGGHVSPGTHGGWNSPEKRILADGRKKLLRAAGRAKRVRSAVAQGPAIGARMWWPRPVGLGLGPFARCWRRRVFFSTGGCGAWPAGARMCGVVGRTMLCLRRGRSGFFRSLCFCAVGGGLQ